jgi:GAF domain-containing protein
LEITARFHFYHTGIFILDDTHQWAILRAASSEGGRRMLARGHRLRVGLPREVVGGPLPGGAESPATITGIVGYVAATGRSRVAANVGDDAVWFSSPDLPHTRSELALPLATETEVVGVLDVQSEDSAAFTEEDISTLQLMADQLTIALTNARALEGMQSALAELRELQVDYARRGWARVTQRMRPLAYEYDRVETAPAVPLAVPEELATGQVRQKLVMDSGSPVVMEALQVGDQVLGYLGLSDSQRIWSEEELALVSSVGEQIALALDNARLFEDTQRNERQQALISRVLQAASDPELSISDVLSAIGLILAQGLDMAVLIFTFLFDGLVDGEPSQGGGPEPSAHVLAHTFIDPDGHDLMVGEQDVVLSARQISFFRGLAQPDTGPSILHPSLIGRIDRRASAATADFDHEQVLYVPIARTAGGAIRAEGFIGLFQRADAAPLDPDTREMTQNLAGQIAMVLENLNLSEETQRRSEELRNLYRISLLLSELLEPRDVLSEIVKQGGRLLGADAANLWVYDPDTQVLALTFEHQGGAEGRLDPGHPTVHLQASPDRWEGLAGQALVEERTIVVPDYRAWPQRRSNLVSSRFRGMMAVPLVGRFGPLGVLVALSEREGYFGERAAGLGDLFSAQAAAALENARLNQEAQQRAEEFQQLYEAGTDLITILDSGVLLSRAAEWARRVLHAERAVVFLRDIESERYVRGQSASEPRYLPTRESDQPDPGGLTEYIVKTRRPLLIRDNSRFQESQPSGLIENGRSEGPPLFSGSSLERLVSVGLMTQMGAPLRIGDEVLGALFVNGTEVDQFGERHLRLLEFLAAQVSSALQNAIQLGQTEQALAVVGQQARYQTNISQAVALLNERGTTAVSDFLRLLGEASEVPAALYVRLVPGSGNGSEDWVITGSWFTESRQAPAFREALLERLPASPAPYVWATILQTQGSVMAQREDLPLVVERILSDAGLGAVLALAVPEESATPGFVLLLRTEDAGGGAGEGLASLWSDQEVVALQTAAVALSNTLARERLFAQVQETLDETEALYRGSAALNEASTFEGILDVLLAHTLLGEQVSTATLHLLDHVWNGDPSPALHPTYSEIVAARSQVVEDGATGAELQTRLDLSKFPGSLEAMRGGAPLFVEDLAADTVLDRRLHALLRRAMNAHSVVIVPLVVGRQRIGYLHADFATPQRFSEAGRRRLMNLSQQAAIAVLNIRQLRATQARVQREQLIREITGHIQEATDVQGVLQTAVRELGRAFGTSRNRIQFRPPHPQVGPDIEE